MKPNLENNLDNKNVIVNQESFTENKSGSKFLESVQGMSKIERQAFSNNSDSLKQAEFDNQLSQKVKNLDPAGRAAYENVLKILIDNNIPNAKQFFIGQNGANLKFVDAFSKYNVKTQSYEPDSVLLAEMTGELKEQIVAGMMTEYSESKLGKASYEFNISDEKMKEINDSAQKNIIGLCDNLAKIWNTPNNKMSGKDFAAKYLGGEYAQNQ